MLGCLDAKHPQVDGLNGAKPIPDSTGAMVPIQQLAEFRGQLLPDPHTTLPLLITRFSMAI